MHAYKKYIEIIEDEIDDLIETIALDNKTTYKRECELHVALENRKHILEMIAEHKEKSPLIK